MLRADADACEVVLAGNHELFVVNRAWKSSRARWAQAAQEAAAQLGPERIEQLRDLDTHVLRPHAELVHGALTNPAYDFVLGARAAHRNLQLLARPLLLFGHTHAPACWAPHKNGRWAREEPVTAGEEHPLPAAGERHGQRLLNPGAVCDRDGARWMQLELGERSRSAVWRQETVRGHGGGRVAEPGRLVTGARRLLQTCHKVPAARYTERAAGDAPVAGNDQRETRASGPRRL